MTALGLASYRGDTEMVRMLVQARADTNYQVPTVSVGVVRVLELVKTTGCC